MPRRITPPTKRQFLQAQRRTESTLAGIVASYLNPNITWRPPHHAIARTRTFPAALSRHYLHRSLADFENTGHLPSGIHTVWNNGLPIDFELDRSQNGSLVTYFHAAITGTVSLPWHVGRSIHRGIPASRLSFNDPSLYLHPDLKIGWFAGNYLQPDLPEVIAAIITKIATDLGTHTTITLGASAGGFAAMNIASHIEGGSTLAINPQTRISTYYPSHANRYKHIAWQGNAAQYNTAGNLLDRLENKPLDNLLYVQNSQDTFHIERHLTPFQQRFGSTFSTLIDDYGPAHSAPDKATIAELIRQQLRDYW